MPQWGKINSQKTFLFQKCYFWILDTFVYLGVFEKKSFSNVLPCYQIQIIKSFIWVNSTESIWLKKYWCFTKKHLIFLHIFSSQASHFVNWVKLLLCLWSEPPLLPWTSGWFKKNFFTLAYTQDFTIYILENS